MFDVWRKTDLEEPEVRATAPDADPRLRDEADPDPLIEEMVARLRDGLSNLVAIDEWGRPLAWRNVVRLALGPLAGRLRDTEQALELAVSMITAPDTVAAAEAPPEEAPEAQYAEPPAPEVEPHAPVVQYAAPQHLAPEPEAAATVEVILPASQAAPEAPMPAMPPAPADVQGNVMSAQPPAVPAGRAAATSLFTVSGDQRSVPVRPFSPGELLRRSGADDSTTAKYDRFLTGLYGQGQQVRGDQDSGSA